MVSSYLPELLGLCDRIAVMRRGRLWRRRFRRRLLTEHDLIMAATTGVGSRMTTRSLLDRAGTLLGLVRRRRCCSACSSAGSSSSPRTSS